MPDEDEPLMWGGKQWQQVLSLLALLVQKYKYLRAAEQTMERLQKVEGMLEGGEVLSLLALLVQKYIY
jgi:hypothetical protein